MSPPPQLSRSATGGLIGSIFGRKPGFGLPETAPVSSKGGRREIPYLAGVAKFQARGPQFMPGSPVLRWRCGLHATGPRRKLRNGGFGGISPVPPSAGVLFAHIPGSGSRGLGKITCLGRGPKAQTGSLKAHRPTAARRGTSRSASTRPAARASARPAGGRRRI